jgi:cytochrome c oxidase assembly factor CtaG
VRAVPSLVQPERSLRRAGYPARATLNGSGHDGFAQSMTGAPAPLAWSFDPLEVVPIGLAALLYARRAAQLARHGRPVPLRRRIGFGAGLAVVLLALVSPIDAIGEERLFSVHMLQHVLLGDLGPLLVVLGLDGRLLRPLLAFRPFRALRVLAHPAVALPLWAIDLCAWHVPFLYDAALRHAPVHACQHLLFFAFGALMWAALFEPLPGPRRFGAPWKAAYLVSMWVVWLALSQVFLWSGHAYYAPYLDVPRTWGLGPLADQRAGGGVMLVEGSFTMLGVLVWLLFRLFGESEARQRLLEGGADPAVAARAARYGRT